MNDSLAIHASGVTRSFGSGFARLLGRPRTEVLRGIDLEVPRGAILGLMGPNGSGKSTMLRILAGVDRETSGTVQVLGAAPNSKQTLLDTGYLPEESQFPPELNATQALKLLGSLQGLSAQETRERSTVLLERVGLAAAKRKPLGAYSRGMLRRFGLAQAWLHDPKLILFDEPTAGLDAQGFEVLDELLGEARAQGTTVVLTSHLLTDLVEYCTHIAVLVNGVIAAAGSPSEILRDEERVTVEIEGLSADKSEALEEWLHEQGAKLLTRGAGSKTMLEVYRRCSGSLER